MGKQIPEPSSEAQMQFVRTQTRWTILGDMERIQSTQAWILARTRMGESLLPPDQAAVLICLRR